MSVESGSYDGTFDGSVDYSVTAVVPITVTVEGAIAPDVGPYWKILPGQRARGFLNGDTEYVSQISSTHQWSATGTVFCDYTATANSATLNTNVAWASPSPYWYWAGPKTRAVVQGAAEFEYAPPGFSPDSIGTGTGTKHLTVVEVPSRVVELCRNSGYVDTTGSIYPGKVTLTSQTSAAEPAMSVDFSAITPPPWTQFGQVCMVQLVNGVYKIDYNVVAAAIGYPCDNIYPANGWHSTYSSHGTASYSDWPDIGSTTPYQLSMQLAFKDWMMYKPAGTTSLPVPVETFAWEHGSETSQSSGSYIYTLLTPSAITSPHTKTEIHPTWSSVFLNQ